MVYIIFLLAILSLCGVLLGYDTGIIYTAAIFFGRDFYLSIVQSSILISLFLAGAVITALLVSRSTNKFGHKKILLLSGFLFVISTICISISTTTSQLLFFCFMLSLASGMVSFTVPNYIIEVFPIRLRVRLILLFLLCIFIGVLAAFTTNHYLLILHMSWRIVFASGTVLAFIFLIGVILMPESPRWLLLYDRDNEAIKSLIKFYGSNYHVQFAEIKSAVIKYKESSEYL